MKKIIILIAILSLALSACASNSYKIVESGEVSYLEKAQYGDCVSNNAVEAGVQVICQKDGKITFSKIVDYFSK